ncbi:MAG TPA: hypothetical protein VMY38_07650 [Gemmatimonadaceae bacterium]|nr:hypothetical protein [Gemmatimonadaceae bacterium]
MNAVARTVLRDWPVCRRDEAVAEFHSAFWAAFDAGSGREGCVAHPRISQSAHQTIDAYE